MKSHFRYRCDFGHQWTISRDPLAPEDPKNPLCPEGHEAVTCQAEEPADEVQIFLQPAARIVDRVRGQKIDAGHYRLIVADLSGRELRVSVNTYKTSEVQNLIGQFLGKSATAATQWWDKSPI